MIIIPPNTDRELANMLEKLISKVYELEATVDSIKKELQNNTTSNKKLIKN